MIRTASLTSLKQMEGMMVNNSAINLKFYKGADLYCDGAIEDEILDILNSGCDPLDVLKSRTDWPILYHLSDMRENILEWYDFKPHAKTLEIGSGCGAVTGVLCRKSEQVTCIDLSLKRSQINAKRNEMYDNFQILVGNFEDIEIDEKYDYITLIGVFEYAASYIHAKKPFHAMLQRIKGFLKEDGILIIAIENKNGLKYWCGAREDHTAGLFDGMQNYVDVDMVRTFSKPEIVKLLNSEGFDDLQFYYPVPDYKLPRAVYSQGHLPGKGDIRYKGAAYDRDRLKLFDEDIAFDNVCEDGQFEYFANSFLIFAQKKEVAR